MNEEQLLQEARLEAEMSEAVSFALWLIDSPWTRDSYNQWKSLDLYPHQEPKTTEQVYAIFKQQQKQE